MPQSIDQLLDRAADLLAADRKVALCLLVKATGSTPVPAGAVLLVDDAAATHGTIGGGCVEAELRRQVMTMISSGRTGVLHFELDHDHGWDDGMICGGSIDVAVALPADGRTLRDVADAYRRREPAQLGAIVDTSDGPDDDTVRQRYVLDLLPRPRLLIAGAGHIGRALCQLALELDFDVTAFDDRADLLDRCFSDPARRVAGPIHESIVRDAIDAETYIVIVTRGHRHDAEVLKAVVEKPARYIGMIGSRRKVQVIMDDLRAGGISDEAIGRVQAPIGLGIGAVTAGEIALSIAAQLVEVRRDGYRSPVRGPLNLDAVST